ncbi:hypothetical protein [Oceanicella actignis]|uniref:Uncharacterized protein n=1 Tax=Oceanicella actignis TaxID=1189325 RepID=A0A1M7SIQ7_9RHOB|nr:hypothetical protein [Oceanicella actignis]SET17379.1 hypothetical protein SAMN04488119_10322 [Oceanicella actignis]SHN58368.1 hypothetical protein SAMN05216200_102487 [Oceanicella actignis]
MFKSPLEKLRQTTWLAALPDTIAVPSLAERPARTRPLDRASVDDIAFALVALEEERRSLGQTIMALEDVLRMARRQGAKGGDNAVAAAVRDLEARK